MPWMFRCSLRSPNYYLHNQEWTFLLISCCTVLLWTKSALYSWNICSECVVISWFCSMFCLLCEININCMDHHSNCCIYALRLKARWTPQPVGAKKIFTSNNWWKIWQVIWHKCDHINIKQLWPVEDRKTKQTKQAMEPLHEQQATLPHLCSCQTPCCSFKWQQVLRVKKKHFFFLNFNNLQHVIICAIYKAWVLPQSKTQKYRKEGKICAVAWCWFKMLIICGATV